MIMMMNSNRISAVYDFGIHGIRFSASYMESAMGTGDVGKFFLSVSLVNGRRKVNI